MTAEELERRLAELEQEVAALEAERRSTADLLDFVAHELMTPVPSLEAFGFIIGRDTPVGESATGKRCLEGIARNTARLVAIVDELLEIGRIRVGRTALERTRFDLRDLAREEIRRAELEGGAEPAIEREVAEDPLFVRADRPRLERAVAEMVRDRAAPLAEGRVEKAFLGQRRAGDAQPAGERGGLGLALAREVIERAGGRAFGASGPGGNALGFELPLDAPPN